MTTMDKDLNFVTCFFQVKLDWRVSYYANHIFTTTSPYCYYYIKATKAKLIDCPGISQRRILFKHNKI